MPRLATVLLLACIAACAPRPAAAPMEAAGTLAITNVTVIAMTGARAVPNQTILIRNGRIVSIVPADSAVSGYAYVLDAAGKYVIPGLWDMHVHNAREGRARHFWPLFLAHGVTGVREMGSYADTILMWRRVLAGAPAAGPRVIWSSPMLDGTPASWTHGIALGGPAEARAMVDSMQALGFDFLKVYERLPRDTYLALAAAARAAGMPFAGHLPDSVDAITAAASGQGSIEHAMSLYAACVPRALELRWSSPAEAAALLLAGVDSATCGRIMAALASNGTAVVPTLTVQRSYAFFADTTRHRDPRIRFVPPRLAARWHQGSVDALRRMPADELEFSARLYDRLEEFVGLLHRNGVTILAGTDASDEPYVFAGASLHDELELLVRSGLEPEDALASATVRAAEFLGLADSLGTVEAGSLADLVVLDADPLADIGNTRRIHAVIAGGRLIGPAGIARLLDSARAEAARAVPSPPARR